MTLNWPPFESQEFRHLGSSSSITSSLFTPLRHGLIWSCNWRGVWLDTCVQSRVSRGREINHKKARVKSGTKSYLYRKTFLSIKLSLRPTLALIIQTWFVRPSERRLCQFSSFGPFKIGIAKNGRRLLLSLMMIQRWRSLYKLVSVFLSLCLHDNWTDRWIRTMICLSFLAHVVCPKCQPNCEISARYPWGWSCKRATEKNSRRK